MNYYWFMSHPYSFLYGSISIQMTNEQTGIYQKLLSLASMSKKRRGYIEHSIGLPYTIEEMAQVFRCPVDVLNEVIDICVKDKNEDGVGSRLEILDDGTLHFTNWDKYQQTSYKRERLSPKELAKVREVNATKSVRLHTDLVKQELIDNGQSVLMQVKQLCGCGCIKDIKVQSVLLTEDNYIDGYYKVDKCDECDDNDDNDDKGV